MYNRKIPLHQSLSMDKDAKVRRARFISRSVEVRGQFAFAAPDQILRAVAVFCCDAYGSPLWHLDSPAANSFYKAWSSCVRRVFGLPLSTFTYLVEGHLAQNFTPLRNMVLGRYPAFYRRLLDSSSKEVRAMASVDWRLVTEDTNLNDVWNYAGKKLKIRCKYQQRHKCQLPNVK